MNIPKLPKYHLYAAQAMMHELTGIDMNEDKFLEFSNYAINQFGRNVVDVKIKVQVEEGGNILLPCDVTEVKYVADDDYIYESWEVAELDPEETMRDNRLYLRPSFGASKYDGMSTPINFSFTEPRLITVSPSLVDEIIYVLAKCPIVDLSDNLPLLYEKQVIAVAWYCAYLKVQRDMFAGIEPPIDFAFLRQKALVLVADARVPESITDNEMDHVLNAKVSKGRKGYNKPMDLW